MLGLGLGPNLKPNPEPKPKPKPKPNPNPNLEVKSRRTEWQASISNGGDHSEIESLLSEYQEARMDLTECKRLTCLQATIDAQESSPPESKPLI